MYKLISVIITILIFPLFSIAQSQFTYNATGLMVERQVTDSRPQPTLPEPIVCPGDNIAVSVTGGTAPYTYLWSDGNNTESTIAALDSTIYSVTVTDDKGCTRVASTLSHGMLCGCVEVLSLLDDPISPGEYRAIISIISNASVPSGLVRLNAGEDIFLDSGFEVTLGAVFEAVVEGGCGTGN